MKNKIVSHGNLRLPIHLSLPCAPGFRPRNPLPLLLLHGMSANPQVVCPEVLRGVKIGRVERSLGVLLRSCQMRVPSSVLSGIPEPRRVLLRRDS